MKIIMNMDMVKDINGIVFHERDNNHEIFMHDFNECIAKYGNISIADIKDLLSIYIGDGYFNIVYLDTKYGYTEPICMDCFKRESRFGLRLNLPEPKLLEA